MSEILATRRTGMSILHSILDTIVPMQITLTGKIEEAFHRHVQTGQFGSAEEAVAALLDDYDAVGLRHNENGVAVGIGYTEFDEPECFAKWKGKFDELLATVKSR